MYFNKHYSCIYKLHLCIYIKFTKKYQTTDYCLKVSHFPHLGFIIQNSIHLKYLNI